MDNLTPNSLKEDFAEICGIHAGDGWLDSRGKEVGYGTSIKERPYFDYVFKLYSKLFDFDVYRILERPGRYNTIELRIASKNIHSTLKSIGFPKGPKINKLRTPSFIFRNKIYIKRFLRGLIDTDGTVHWRRYDKRYYLIITWNCTSRLFAYEIKALLERLGYLPNIYSCSNKRKDYRRKTIWRIYLQKKKDIYNFINSIGFRNNSKLDQISIKKEYLEKYGPSRT